MAAVSALTMAEMAADTYEPQCSMLGAWTFQDLIDRNNFHARAYKHNKASLAVVAFRGTANMRDALLADGGAIGLSLNALALELNSAIDFTGKLNRSFGMFGLQGIRLAALMCSLLPRSVSCPAILSMRLAY